MKKIFPAKFLVLFTIICLIIFPAVAFVFFDVIVYLFSAGKLPFYMIFLFLAVGLLFEMEYLFTKGIMNSIVFENGTVTNHIYDGTNNDGWREELSNVKSVKLVGKEEVQKYYKQFNKEKAILIDFGNGNVKYIYAGMFSKRQIKKIMKRLQSHETKTQES